MCRVQSAECTARPKTFAWLRLAEGLRLALPLYRSSPPAVVLERVRVRVRVRVRGNKENCWP